MYCKVVKYVFMSFFICKLWYQKHWFAYKSLC